jgi:hypothetical protein
MRRAYQTFNGFLLARSYLFQVAIFYLSSFLFAIVSLPLLFLADEIAKDKHSGPNPTHIFTALIVAPVVETLIFQLLIFKIFERAELGEKKYLWIILISSFLFGLSHFYSFDYIIVTIFKGFVFAYTFYFYRTNSTKAFWTTTLIHCMHNLTILLLDK